MKLFRRNPDPTREAPPRPRPAAEPPPPAAAARLAREREQAERDAETRARSASEIESACRVAGAWFPDDVAWTVKRDARRERRSLLERVFGAWS